MEYRFLWRNIDLQNYNNSILHHVEDKVSSLSQHTITDCRNKPEEEDMRLKLFKKHTHRNWRIALLNYLCPQ